jgi:hypothetical protein
MLGKMLIHGLVAAALVGGTAAVYAASQDGQGLPQVDTVAASLDTVLSQKPGDDRFARMDDRREHQRRSHHKHDHDDDDD